MYCKFGESCGFIFICKIAKLRVFSILTTRSANGGGMSITIEMNNEAGYFVSYYKGAITDANILSDWKFIMDSGAWIPGKNELADLSEADLSGLTTDGIRALADYFISMSTDRNVASMKKTAIYATNELNFGLARMYGVFAFESSQKIEFFYEREKAIQWLGNDKQ